MAGATELLLLASYVLGCLGLGLLICRVLEWGFTRLTPPSPATMLASALILGQGSMALFLTLLGLAALLKAWTIWLSIALGVIGGGLLGWRVVYALPHQLKRVWDDLTSEDLGWRLIPVFAASTIALHAAACTLPLTHGDATIVYMAEARLMASTGRIMPVPGMELRLKSGLVGELHYAALMALGTGTQTPRLFVLTLTLAMGIVLAALGRITGMERRGQWILASILLTSSVATNVISDGKVDLFAAALGITAFYWASLADRDERGMTARLRIAAVLGSLSVVAKPTYIVSLLIPLVLFIVWRNLKLDTPRTPRTVLIRLRALTVGLGLWVLIPQLPHLLKNLVLFHEPFAPFLGRTGGYWLSQSWLSADNVSRLMLVYPLALVFGDYPHPVSQYGRLSFAVLALAPLGLLMPRQAHVRHGVLSQLSVVAIVGIVLWAVIWPTIFVPRYFMVPLLLLALLPARAAEYASLHWRRPLRLHLMVLLTILLAFYSSVHSVLRTYYPINVAKRELGSYVMHFLARNDLGRCDKIQWNCPPLDALNRRAVSGARILIHEPLEPVTFWLRPDLVQCLRNSADPPLTYDAQVNWNMLIRRGYSYLIISDDALRNNDLGVPDKTPDWIHLELVHQGAAQSVYRFSSALSSTTPEWTCQETAPGIWTVQNTAGQGKQGASTRSSLQIF